MSLLKHLQECARESGVDLTECHTSQRTVTYRGHAIEVYYDEGSCMWRAFVMGLGEQSHFFEYAVTDAAKAAIDQNLAAHGS